MGIADRRGLVIQIPILKCLGIWGRRLAGLLGRYWERERKREDRTSVGCWDCYGQNNLPVRNPGA